MIIKKAFTFLISDLSYLDSFGGCFIKHPLIKNLWLSNGLVCVECTEDGANLTAITLLYLAKAKINVDPKQLYAVKMSQQQVKSFCKCKLLYYDYPWNGSPHESKARKHLKSILTCFVPFRMVMFICGTILYCGFGLAYCGASSAGSQHRLHSVPLDSQRDIFIRWWIDGWMDGWMEHTCHLCSILGISGFLWAHMCLGPHLGIVQYTAWQTPPSVVPGLIPASETRINTSFG